jgi:hypothetical protein
LGEKMDFSVKKKMSIKEIIEYFRDIKDAETTLTDPNIRIADMGATVHSKANVAFANNWESDISNTILVMENGSKEKFTRIKKSKE